MPLRVTELYCIMPIANVASVMVHGILSHDEAARLSHADISLAEVQKRREQKSVPGGLRLHEYANLYFCARIPMMYRRQSERERLCVLLVDRRLLKSPGVVLSTGNAASDYSRVLTSPAGLQEIAWDDVFADYCTDENPLKQMRKKSAKCAEVLVPHGVKPCFISGAYGSCTTGRDALLATGFELPITINPYTFFG